MIGDEADHERRRRGGTRLDPRTLQEIIRRVVKVAQPERLILFGSAARGDMGPHSDVDLLVIAKVEDRSAVTGRVHRRLRGEHAAVDAIVVTPPTWLDTETAMPWSSSPPCRKGV